MFYYSQTRPPPSAVAYIIYNVYTSVAPSLPPYVPNIYPIFTTKFPSGLLTPHTEQTKLFTQFRHFVPGLLNATFLQKSTLFTPFTPEFPTKGNIIYTIYTIDTPLHHQRRTPITTFTQFTPVVPPTPTTSTYG